MISATGWLTAVLDEAGSRPEGRKLRQCPAHVDAAPSLSIGPGRDGSVLLHCFAGCSWREVLRALRCPPSTLWTPPPVSPRAWSDTFLLELSFPPIEYAGGHPAATGYRLAAVHDYSGWLLERWRRPTTGAKDLRWHTKRNGASIPGLFGVRLDELPLYREPDVRMAVAAGEPVLLVESESSVDALVGHYATTWPGGASAVQINRLVTVLGGYPHLVVIPDFDQAGLICLGDLTVAGLVPHVIMPAPGEDARDLYDRLGPTGFGQLVIDTVKGP